MWIMIFNHHLPTEITIDLIVWYKIVRTLWLFNMYSMAMENSEWPIIDNKP